MFSRLATLAVDVFGRSTVSLVSLRTAGQQLRIGAVNVAPTKLKKSTVVNCAVQVRQLSTLLTSDRSPINSRVGPTVGALLAANNPFRTPSFVQPKRDHIKFSLTKGRQKTVKSVVTRFFRLRWGGWIRPMIGRKKRLWKKSWQKKQRLQRHVLCKPQHNRLFDHMVTRFWKRPKWYVDDPYEPYHVRNDFPYKLYTRRRPPT